MPTLTAIDTSVTDSRITLTFSHRATAQLYAKHLESEDRRNPSSFPGSYRRAPRFNPKSKEVSVALPPFITWFITCRLPDDEDSITFTFDDADEGNALRWAEGMVVFERVPAPAANSGHGAGYDDHDHDGLKQLHVRRLWNAERLQKSKSSTSRTTTKSPRSPPPRNNPSPRQRQ
ncbi:hypothetical protein B0T16DRAFT_425958 [Cercophora newfieldiana]|uniref:Uncharacterized protein n=1 Tax=Cercophora newfieldiana TaxID=92897 RepID=A0AA39YSQ9_9PEZI|nr:hypothetical protein B0T16DRAFT_425958 [Cercophora newfieldiana]